jgi:L-lactate dehydrogenase complex protein LldF
MCPVYGKIGGHAYGSAYSGPVGAVVTPLLSGINQASDLCLGESLCGACMPACPVNINIPRMLLQLRAKLAEGDTSWNVKVKSRAEQVAFKAWFYLIRNRRIYDIFLKGAYIGQHLLPGTPAMIRCLPFAGKGWTRGRDLKRLAPSSFIQRYSNKNGRRKMK